MNHKLGDGVIRMLMCFSNCGVSLVLVMVYLAIRVTGRSMKLNFYYLQPTFFTEVAARDGLVL